jgi:PAS domain-containing protein
VLNYINQTAPALLQSILTASKNAVTVYQAVRNPSGKLINLRLRMLNAAAERHLGYSASEVIGLPFDQLLPHLVDTGLYDHYRQVIETGQSTQFEFQYTRPDRPGPCWCDVSAVRMDDSVVVTYDDITRRKADANAARLASVLEQAFDASVNGITVLEAISDEQGEISDFRFLMINEAGLRMSGYTRDYLLNRTLWEVYPATGINGLFAEYKRVFQTGHPYSGEHYYPEYDVWRSIHVVPIPGGLMLSYTDCTAEKKLAETTRQQADLLQAILDGSPNAILAFDAEGDPAGSGFLFRCTLQNAASRRLTGRSDQEVKGLTLDDIFPASLAHEARQHVINVFTTGQSAEYELAADLGAGQGWYSLSIVRRDKGILLTIQDKTAEKQATTRLHQRDQLLHAIAENSPAGLVLWEAVHDDSPQRRLIDFRYKLANQTNSYLTGYPAEALIGQNLLSLFPVSREQSWKRSCEKRWRLVIRSEWALPIIAKRPIAGSMRSLCVLVTVTRLNRYLWYIST